MFKYYLSCMLCLLMLSARAQTDTLLYYLKNTGDIVKKENADYVMIILPQDSTNKNLFPVFQYYINGKRKLISATSSRKDLALEGPTVSFFPNGKRISSVIFKNGHPTGIENEYYPNGKLYTIRDYKKNGRVLLIECRDSIGNVLAEKGNGKWLKLTGNYERIIGEWPVNEGVIPTESIAWGQRIDYGEINFGDDFAINDSLRSDTLPRFSVNPNALNKFVIQNLRYTEIDLGNNISAKVMMAFTVEEDGRLTNFKILKSVSPTTDAEVLRIIKLSSPWIPAKYAGKPIKSDYTLPVIISPPSSKF